VNQRRLFFALWPSDRQREMLRDTLRPVLTSVEGDTTDRRNWHVTLVFIGDFPEEQIPFLQAAAADVECGTIRLRFDRLTFWQRPRIACLQPVTVPAALEQVVASLKQLLTAFDVAPEERAYRPHITVARRARAFDDLLLTRPVDLEWNEFELVESVSAPGGVSYRPLKQ
jgi:RNA 2',3'-cyclic 3'-phosphodiesterase